MVFSNVSDTFRTAVQDVCPGSTRDCKTKPAAAPSHVVNAAIPVPCQRFVAKLQATTVFSLQAIPWQVHPFLGVIITHTFNVSR